jgi:uncharacterized repeat protein (TIGR03847 family)
MSDSVSFPSLDRLTVGAIGEPGQRLFFLQARRGGQVVTLKVEKAQVAALAELIVRTLADLPATGPLPEDLEPDLFVEPDWIVGALGLAYDSDADRLLLMAAEVTGDPDREPDLLDNGENAVARLGATREQVAALADRGAMLVAAGRPPCPLCGFPLDPSGHSCPKLNGPRPPTP